MANRLVLFVVFSLFISSSNSFASGLDAQLISDKYRLLAHSIDTITKTTTKQQRRNALILHSFSINAFSEQLNNIVYLNKKFKELYSIDMCNDTDSIISVLVHSLPTLQSISKSVKPCDETSDQNNDIQTISSALSSEINNIITENGYIDKRPTRSLAYERMLGDGALECFAHHDTNSLKEFVFIVESCSHGAILDQLICTLDNVETLDKFDAHSDLRFRLLEIAAGTTAILSNGIRATNTLIRHTRQKEIRARLKELKALLTIDHDMIQKKTMRYISRHFK